MKRRGFTLVEIMIVVAVICLLAGVAISSLLRAHVTGQESNAAANLNSVALAQIQFRVVDPSHTYATLAGLAGASPSYIDSLLGSGAKQGYDYNVTLPGGGTSEFYACAVHRQRQGHSFYIDQRGNLCRSVDAGQNCPTSSLSGTCTGQWAGLVESSGGGGVGATGMIGGAGKLPGGAGALPEGGSMGAE